MGANGSKKKRGGGLKATPKKKTGGKPQVNQKMISSDGKMSGLAGTGGEGKKKRK